MSLPTEPLLLVANTGQSQRVRWCFWASLVVMAGFFYWAWDLSQTFGLSPGDGGVLRPLEQRLFAAAILVVIGILPVIGMVLYLRRYIAGLAWQGEDVLVTGVGWPAGERRFPLASFEPGKDHDGELYTVTHWVNAPWSTVGIEGRTYIIDLQAEHVDREGLARMLTEARRRSQRI